MRVKRKARRNQRTPTEHSSLQPATQRSPEPQAAEIAQTHPQTSAPENLVRLQQTIGNHSVTRLISRVPQPEAGAGRAIQRAPALLGKVEEYKEKLGIKGVVKIVIVPNNTTTKLYTLFSQYPTGYTQNLTTTDLDLSLLKVNHSPEEAAKYINDPEEQEYINTPAHIGLSLWGGGGYNNKHRLFLVIDGDDEKAFSTLFHEMGHLRQHEDGSHIDNTNRIILEYHNVLYNENLNNSTPRLCYNEDNSKKVSSKKWSDLEEDIKNSDEKVNVGSLKLLDEIKEYIEKNFEPKDQATVKQNLINEYYGAKKK